MIIYTHKLISRVLPLIGKVCSRYEGNVIALRAANDERHRQNIRAKQVKTF